MNKGFSIEIQEDLSKEEKKFAENFADGFILSTMRNDWDFPLKGGGGYNSYLRRGRFGRLLKDNCWSYNGIDNMNYIKSNTGGNKLVFRRLSRNRRVFGIIDHKELVTYPDKKEISVKKCFCPKCLGMERVTWREDKPKTYTYCTIGNIRG